MSSSWQLVSWQSCSDFCTPPEGTVCECRIRIHLRVTQKHSSIKDLD